MFRVIFFWSTAASILMAAGLVPVPSASHLPEFSIPEISTPGQPSLLADLSNAGMDLPELGRIIEERITRPRPGAAIEAPEMPAGVTAAAAPQTASEPKPTTGYGSDIVHFDFDNAELDAQAKATLDEFAMELAANPAARISIYGYTDRPGETAYNDFLGKNRAEQVANYLMNLGLPAERITVVRSYGETAPAVETNGISRENRRVRIETTQSL